MFTATPSMLLLQCLQGFIYLQLIFVVVVVMLVQKSLTPLAARF